MTANTSNALRVKKVCALCGSDDVCHEAAARWNIERQDWDITTFYDEGGHCESCNRDTDLVDQVIG